VNYTAPACSRSGTGQLVAIKDLSGVDTAAKEWWKHLREVKRMFWHGERLAARVEIEKQLREENVLEMKETFNCRQEIAMQSEHFAKQQNARTGREEEQP
jgi:hypothetical protein